MKIVGAGFKPAPTVCLPNDMKNLIDKLISCGIEESEAKKEISILRKEFKDQNKIKEIIGERIKTRKPLQYLLGKAYFMDFTVKVNEKVLIPRPETEILVEEAVKRLKAKDLQTSADCFVGTNVPPRNDKLTVLDIGTGSGIIAIALAKLIPNIKIIAIDLEKEIIDLAYENAKLNGVQENINFKICDLFSSDIHEIFKQNKFDLIISNPPYVKENEMAKRPELLYEPKVALIGSKENKTGMIYYERIVELCRRDLINQTPTALVALEIDPPLVGDLKILLKNNGLNNYEIIKDYAKLDRCLFVYP